MSCLNQDSGSRAGTPGYNSLQVGFDPVDTAHSRRTGSDLDSGRADSDLDLADSDLETAHCDPVDFDLETAHFDQADSDLGTDRFDHEVDFDHGNDRLDLEVDFDLGRFHFESADLDLETGHFDRVDSDLADAWADSTGWNPDMTLDLVDLHLESVQADLNHLVGTVDHTDLDPDVVAFHVPGMAD
jgi:hypothetical protein